MLDFDCGGPSQLWGAKGCRREPPPSLCRVHGGSIEGHTEKSPQSVGLAGRRFPKTEVLSTTKDGPNPKKDPATINSQASASAIRGTPRANGKPPPGMRTYLAQTGGAPKQRARLLTITRATQKLEEALSTKYWEVTSKGSPSKELKSPCLKGKGGGGSPSPFIQSSP